MRAKRITISNINAALKERGIDAEIVKGDGYFWFSGPAVERAYSTSVMTPRLTAMTVEEWVCEAEIVIESARR